VDLPQHLGALPISDRGIGLIGRQSRHFFLVWTATQTLGCISPGLHGGRRDAVGLASTRHRISEAGLWLSGHRIVACQVDELGAHHARGAVVDDSLGRIFTGHAHVWYVASWMDQARHVAANGTHLKTRLSGE